MISRSRLDKHQRKRVDCILAAVLILLLFLLHRIYIGSIVNMFTDLMNVFKEIVYKMMNNKIEVIEDITWKKEAFNSFMHGVYVTYFRNWYPVGCLHFSCSIKPIILKLSSLKHAQFKLAIFGLLECQGSWYIISVFHKFLTLQFLFILFVYVLIVRDYCMFDTKSHPYRWHYSNFKVERGL